MYAAARAVWGAGILPGAVPKADRISESESTVVFGGRLVCQLKVQSFMF